MCLQKSESPQHLNNGVGLDGPYGSLPTWVFYDSLSMLISLVREQAENGAVAPKRMNISLNGKRECLEIAAPCSCEIRLQQEKAFEMAPEFLSSVEYLQRQKQSTKRPRSVLEVTKQSCDAAGNRAGSAEPEHLL